MKMRLDKALELLGTTPEEVAVNLSRFRCQGKKRSKTACPLAVYINLYADTWPNPSVLMDRLAFGDAQICDYWWPNHISEFAKRFENGDYPYLELLEMKA